MDFFAAQELSRRRSRRLLWLFVLAAVLIMLAVTATLGVVVAVLGDSLDALLAQPGSWIVAHSGILLLAALAALAVIGISSVYRTSSLAGGGGKVALALGGTEVPPDTQDPQLRQLRNVTEEMAIASGVPVPDLYVLENEPGINAFAAGYTPANAAVAVTRGALEQLDREELQGVVAHEFSHILNGDMRLNIRLMGLLFGILVVGLTGRLLLHSARFGALRSSGSSRNNNGNAAVVAVLLGGVLLVLIGSIGVFFGRLIRAGISRQREYLADASAVQFTRNNRGIAGALKKIGGYADGSEFKAADSEEVSHMLFARGAQAFSGMFATHPPLAQRIAALDRTFVAAPSAQSAMSAAATAGGYSAAEAAGAMGLAGGGSAAGPGSPATADLAGGAGQVGEQHVSYARHLRRSLPADLDEAVHNRDGAAQVVLALLLDADPRRRERQLELLRGRLGTAAEARVESLAGQAAEMGAAARLPLLELAFPALKEHSERELKDLLALAEQAGRIDGELGFFQYCLLRLLGHYVEEALVPPRGWPREPHPQSVRKALSDLYRVMAMHGAAGTDESAARRAFEAGRAVYAKQRGQKPEQALDEYRPVADWQKSLDAALPMIAELPASKVRAALDGLIAVAAHDHELDLSEYELLRVLCAVLDVPLPPLLPGRIG